jgi:predicted house-cleaning noncanonical NTP pyrophosphatase (MazG superfamily)
MFFVDNKPQATYPLCLPWYFNTDDIPSGISIDDTAVPVYNQPKTISNRADLAELVDLASSGTLPPRSSVRLKPDPEHVRDPDFAAEVAGVVTEHEIAVELEGSTLHHAYYVLDRAGARVRCVDPFEPDPVELQYGKLVRDKIPAQIEARGERVIASRVTGSGLMEALKEKAIEEAHEVFTESESVDLIEEVADLYEVMRSLVNVMGRDFDEVVSIADKKRDEAGGFAEGWILEGTEQLPLLRRTRRESDRAADSLVSAERPRSSDLSKVRPSTGHVSRPRLIKEGRRIVARLLPSRSNPERQYLAVYPGDKFVEVTVDAGSLSVAVKKVASVDTAALVRRAQLDLFADGE